MFAALWSIPPFCFYLSILNPVYERAFFEPLSLNLESLTLILVSIKLSREEPPFSLHSTRKSSSGSGCHYQHVNLTYVFLGSPVCLSSGLLNLKTQSVTRKIWSLSALHSSSMVSKGWLIHIAFVITTMGRSCQHCLQCELNVSAQAVMPHKDIKKNNLYWLTSSSMTTLILVAI